MQDWKITRDPFLSRWTLHFDDEVHTTVTMDRPDQFSEFVEWVERKRAKQEKETQRACRVAV
jgi:hypothetical protein